ncbi:MULTISPECIES: hypothetical protein [unclassified Marinovum]
MHIVAPANANEEWSYSQAVEHCAREFQNFRQRFKVDPSGVNDPLFHTALEHIDGAELAQLSIAPDNSISQPICIPRPALNRELVSAADNLEVFCILRAAGLRSMETRSLDMQPRAFREWFGGVCLGRIQPPGKRPKSWGDLKRNELIYYQVTELAKHGLTVFRNDASAPHSALDAIADAAKAAGLPSPRSYETVKRIYTEVRRRKSG